MRKFLLITFLSLLGLQASLSAGEGWTTDFKAAQAKAKAEGKHLFVEFTGSDWCPPCMALHRNVFSKAAFKDYAEKSLVWVMLDFPKDKPQSKELREHNIAIRDKYNVSGYPTILIFEPAGELIGKTGFRRGGAEAYITHINEMIASAE
ncbi:MAG: thioredoxin-related protein [Candidatus Azotimanducaceae bacterium]|jgi:thioredoxin-related protein